MRDMTEAELHAFYDKGQCPRCGGGEFLKGPAGGWMRNIKCCHCSVELNISQGGFPRAGQVIAVPAEHIPAEEMAVQIDSESAAKTSYYQPIQPPPLTPSPSNSKGNLFGIGIICIVVSAFCAGLQFAIFTSPFTTMAAGTQVFVIGTVMAIVGCGGGIYLLRSLLRSAENPQTPQ